LKQHPELHLNMDYRSQEEFFQLLLAQNYTFDVFTQDYLPYRFPISDTWWTGFYTSRTALKSAARRTDNQLRNTEFAYTGAQIMTDFEMDSDGSLFDLLQSSRRWSGILCHHDAVTGTSRQAVVDDYNEMLKNSSVGLNSVFESSMNQWVLGNSKATQPQLNANISQVLEENEDSVLVVFNSVGWQRTEYLELPSSNLSIRNSETGVLLNSQNLRNGNTIFAATVPAIGFSTYYLEFPSKENSENEMMFMKSKQTQFIENIFFRINLDSTTGQPQSILLKSYSQSINWFPHVMIR